MYAQNSSRQEIAIPCPVCGEPSTSIKKFFIFHLFVFLWVYVWWRQGEYVACPRCMRKYILKRMAINLIPANLAWLFLIFPIGILEIVASYLDGHSVAVKKIIQEHVDNE